MADTQKAVDLVREAMGRTPAPGEMLREILQGRPLDASLEELVQEPGAFSSAPVRVRARLVRAESASGLRLEADGVSLAVQAAPGAEASFGVVAAWVDQEVELVGRLAAAREGAGSASRGRTLPPGLGLHRPRRGDGHGRHVPEPVRSCSRG